MKLADELKRTCRRNPLSLYYDMLVSDMRKEAKEGGGYRVVSISPNNYNPLCKKLMNDGFDVRIYNFNVDNPSHLVYIIWDKDKFEEVLKESDLDVKTFHYGLI